LQRTVATQTLALAIARALFRSDESLPEFMGHRQISALQHPIGELITTFRPDVNHNVLAEINFHPQLFLLIPVRLLPVGFLHVLRRFFKCSGQETTETASDYHLNAYKT
jgi:hypothetical protein